jgi:predicted Rossmann fold flavoprotein
MHRQKASRSNPRVYDAAILGAGASGLMCAVVAARSGKKIILIDHQAEAGRKIAVSGGGHCNFTNRFMDASKYAGENPHFVKSAIARFGPDNVVSFFAGEGLEVVEADGGCLFFRRYADAVVGMFMRILNGCGADLALGCRIDAVEKKSDFVIRTSGGAFHSKTLVVATGGISYKKLGASGVGYEIARKFGHRIVEPRPALVPLLWDAIDKKAFGALAGIGVDAGVRLNSHEFTGGLLFTHRGLSGPAILNASLYWKGGDRLSVDLLPNVDIEAEFKSKLSSKSRQPVHGLLSRHIPKRLAIAVCGRLGIDDRPIASFSLKRLSSIAAALHAVEVVPKGHDSFDIAEVTSGGVSTEDISSKTMESRLVPGLYFTGEVLDVTGALGGYNLHFAWASGRSAGLSI